MRKLKVRPLTEKASVQLIRTARKQMPASLWIKGGQVLNVFTREWQQLHVVVAGERIAYVGEQEPLVDEQTECIDATGYYLVPGYIEPHAHPFHHWYNVFSLANHALRTGTTTMIADTLVLSNLLPLEEVEDVMKKTTAHPVKHFFWARLDPQVISESRSFTFTKEGLSRMINHPLVLQGGELTDWRAVLEEEEEMLFGLKLVRDRGKRMEGHHPGASVETLNIAAAAGVTACHESISAEEVLHRIRLGMYATLRHSSIRPDLPDLISGLQRLQISWTSRLMLTSDGSSPVMMRHGFMDYIIKVAIDAGVPPTDAYAMATLHPATYYGLDGEIGGIAPGRIADILLLRTPENPSPELVIANGRREIEGGHYLHTLPTVDWHQYSFPGITGKLKHIHSDWFKIQHTGNTVPVLRMINAVILKLEWEDLPKDSFGHVSIEHDPELAFIVLLDPVGKRMTQALVRGYGSDLEALASTFTASSDWLVIGRTPSSMASALQKIIEFGGGIAVMSDGEIVYEMPLPLAGKMTELPMEEVIAKGEEYTSLLREKGHVHLDPIYSLLFFTATHLPFVRLTSEGIYDVKESKVIVPAIKISEHQ